MVSVEWRYSPFVQSTPEGENGKQAIEVPVYMGDFPAAILGGILYF